MLAAALLALALVAGPLGAGVFAGVLFRRRYVRTWQVALLAVVLCALTPFALVALARVGLRDGVLIGAWLALGLFVGRRGLFAHRRDAGLALAATALALALGEAVVRIALPPPPRATPIDTARVRLAPIDTAHLHPGDRDLVFEYRWALEPCGFMHPDRYPEYFRERVPRTMHETTVLFTGDSMTAGLGVPLDQAFPGAIGTLLPDVGIANAGCAGMSLDYSAALVEPWLAKLPGHVPLVVVGAFFNDVFEMDRPDACCMDRPLLAYDAAGAHVRCTEPRFANGYGTSLAWFARYSPAPYPLRVLAGVSHLAGYLRAFFEPTGVIHASRAFRRAAGDHLRLALASIRASAARHGALAVVVPVPYRPLLLPTPDAGGHAEEVTMLHRAIVASGLPVLDPTEHLRMLVRRDGDAPYFLEGNDFHFSARGHRALGEWLAPRIRQLVANASTAR